MTAFEISYEGYRISRVPVRPSESTSGTSSADYTIYRPDGSICCHGISWPDVERIVADDLRRRGESKPEA